MDFFFFGIILTLNVIKLFQILEECMKASKFLAVILAALLPALGSAKMVTYSYPDILSSPADGKLFSTRRIVLEPLENVRYSVTVWNTCGERCELKDMETCKVPLKDFQLMTICNAEKKPLTQTNEQRNCAYGERLSTFLKNPLKNPATVSVEIEITFDDEKMHVLKVMGQLKKNLPQEFIDRIVKQEEEKLRQLEEQHDAAHLAAVKSTAEYERAVAERERAVAEREQATAELQQASAAFNASQRAYDASKREFINSLEAYTAELQSACEQMFQ